MPAVHGLVLYTGVLFAPGGLVSRWGEGIEFELLRHIGEAAPVNKRPNKGRSAPPVGTLKASINANLTHAGKTLHIEVASDATYSLAVLRGTGTIFAKTARIPKGFTGAGRFRIPGPGSGMYLPANPGHGKSKFVQQVSGQTSNNFMQRGVDRVAVSHPSLRGMTVF